jgi:hypothetical protein
MMNDEIQTCKTQSKYIQSHQVAIPVPFASFCSKSFGLTFSRVHSHWKTTADLFNAQHSIQFAHTKRSFTSAHVLCSSFNESFLSSCMTCWVRTLTVKVPVTLSKELPAGLGLQTANRNSNKVFWLIVKYFSPFASSWDSCWMIAITSKSINALPFGGKSNKSFDNKSSSTFQLVDASVYWISKADLDFSDIRSQIFVHFKADSNFSRYLSAILQQFYKMCSTSQMVVMEHKPLHKSNSSTFRFIARFKQQHQSLTHKLRQR